MRLSNGGPPALGLPPLSPLFSGLMATLLLSTVACDPAADAANATVPPPPPVELLTASREVFHDQVTITANIAPERQVKLIPRVPGRIEEITAEAGDEVEEGEVVARLERRDYLLGVKQARAQLAAARATAELASVGVSSAELTRRRMKALRASDAISQSDLDKVVDGHRIGQAKQSAAEAQVLLAQVGLEAARTKLADTVLRAPFDGVVVKRLLDEGELCGQMPPAIISILADLTPMKASGAVSELELARLHEGIAAEVRVDALPGEPFAGTVARVSPMVDPRTRTATVEISVPNEDRRLDPGMSAEITIDLGEREVVAVADDALLRAEAGDDRATLYVVDDDHVAHRREVQLGARRGELVEVQQGLEPGERVIRAGQRMVRDGQRVTPRATSERQ